MTAEVVEVYRNLASGGVGLIITGSFPVVSEPVTGTGKKVKTFQDYKALRVTGAAQLPLAVHQAAPDCKIIAQFETDYLSKVPSTIQSPFSAEPRIPFNTAEIKEIINSFIQAIVAAKEDGFDGVQLHAAHGGFLSSFLSPYSNKRIDAYGGSVNNRVRVVREIISGAREQVGDYPILIKLNGTDYLEDGINLQNFPQLAEAIADCGVDAVEVSGGMWECLARPEEELGFRPVPSPESHTHISNKKNQSYFLPFAEVLDLDIPVILTGGNRDVERLEQIITAGKVDFIGLCRPLIREPDLPKRWQSGVGKSGTKCCSCNACLYDMYVHPGRETPGLVHCVFKADKQKYRQAKEWLSTWVEGQLIR